MDGLLRIRTAVERGHVRLPNPMQEYGALRVVPAGCRVLLDIGRAERIDQMTAWSLAGAVRLASAVTVLGDDPDGLAQVCNALDRALGTLAVRQ